VLSAVGALAVAAALVWQDAYAAFTDTTTNLPASVSTGTVALSNNVEGYYPLTMPEMWPGDSDTQCIIVSSTGTEPSLVKLYSTRPTGNATLAGSINFSWTAGTGGGANGDCTGFVASGTPVTSTMAAFPTSFATGALAWNTAGGAAVESKTYRLTYSMATNPPASTKGTSAALTFVWEAQNR
jgi:hypothetical protein